MSYFVWLSKAVAGAVNQKRIGSPVSLRASFYLSADHGLLLPTLGEALAAASAWMASPTVRVYALGDVRRGEITVLAEYAGGQTAMLSAGILRDPATRADILLIGNRGTLRYADHPPVVEPARGDPKIVRAIEKSLAARRPVEVEP